MITVIKLLLIVLTLFIFGWLLYANLPAGRKNASPQEHGSAGQGDCSSSPQEHGSAGQRNDDLSPRRAILVGLSQILTWFLATFGVSDTAVNLVMYQKAFPVDTRRLAPTIVTGALIPLAVMSYAYLDKVAVDPFTVVFLVVLQCIGGFFGAMLANRLKIRTIRGIMGTVLIIASLILFARLFFLKIEGGTANGLTGWKLITAGLLLSFMQALVMMGFANTVPGMCVLLMLGMSPTAVYPLIMTGEFFGCATSCIKVLQDGNYHRRIALIEAVCGAVGVIAAVNLVAGMNVLLLQILMILLMLYCSYTMFRANAKEP